jgi:hypothetical protein
MKNMYKLVWYVQNGKTISKMIEEDEDHVWGRVMEYFNGDWQKASKYYRSFMELSNEDIHILRQRFGTNKKIHKLKEYGCQ